MAELIKTRHNDLVYFTSPRLLSAGGIAHGFFTKKGGFSKGDSAGLSFRFTGDDYDTVKRNYGLAAECFGKAAEDIVFTRQTHTSRVEAVTEKLGFSAFDTEGVDGLVTNVPGIVLAGFYADCQLLLFSDEKAGCIGLCHSGWRGVAGKIAKNTVEKMCSLYGAKPEDILCAVSPSICTACFETDGDVPAIMEEAYGEKVRRHMEQGEKKWHVDLKAITFDLLCDCGLKPENIDISSLCPCCGDAEEFWSHRRQGGKRGVHAGMIVMQK